MPGKRMIHFMAGLLFAGIFCLNSGAFGYVPSEEVCPASEVVFIDPSVQEIEKIVAQLPQGAEVVRLSPGMDGVGQISAHLAKKTDLSAIHILSHGEAGHFVLNGKRIDGDFLRDHGNRINPWGRALAGNGDILLYACNLAATDEGKAFVERFVDLTDADVAASTDVTGGIVFNGNWNLEYTVGKIDCIKITVGPNIHIELPAGESNWIGEANSSWSDPRNWDGDGIPQGDYDVTISNTDNDPVYNPDSTPPTYANFTISSNATLYVQGDDTILSVSGTFDATGGAVIFTGAGNLKLASTVTSLGTFTKATGTVTYYGDVAQSVAAVNYYGIAFGGTGTKTATSSLTAATLSAPEAAYSVALNGGCTITNLCTFLNTGTTTIGNDSSDSSTFEGGLTATAGPVSIAGTVATPDSPMELGATALTANSRLKSTGEGSATITVASMTGDYNLTLQESESSATSEVTFTGNLAVNELITFDQGYSLTLQGASNVINTSTSFSNTGTTTIGNDSSDTSTFTGGLTATAGPVSIAGTVATTDSAMVLGATTQTKNSTLKSGSGAITVTSMTGNFDLTLQDNTTGATGGVTFTGNPGRKRPDNLWAGVRGYLPRGFKCN